MNKSSHLISINQLIIKAFTIVKINFSCIDSMNMFLQIWGSRGKKNYYCLKYNISYPSSATQNIRSSYGLLFSPKLHFPFFTNASYMNFYVFRIHDIAALSNGSDRLLWSMWTDGEVTRYRKTFTISSTSIL